MDLFLWRGDELNTVFNHYLNGISIFVSSDDLQLIQMLLKTFQNEILGGLRDLFKNIFFYYYPTCQINQRDIGEIFDLGEPLEGDGSCGRGKDHIHQSGLESNQDIGDSEWNGLHPG